MVREFAGDDPIDSEVRRAKKKQKTMESKANVIMLRQSKPCLLYAS